MSIKTLSESIVRQCDSQIPQLLPNLSLEERKFVRCQYCILNESDLEELFTSGNCFPSDYTSYFPFVFLLYGAILLLALPGNLFIVLTIASFKTLHSVTHFFIANLAVGDLLMTVFCISFSVVSIIVLQYWPFGEVLCVTVNYFQAVSVFVSAYTHVAISIDRYLAIIYPLRPRLSRCQAKVIIICVWMMAFATTVPVAVFSKLLTPEDRIYDYLNVKVCQEKWPEVHLANMYTLTLSFLQYFFPLAVLLFTYCRIVYQVWGSSKAKEENFEKMNSSFSLGRKQNSHNVLRKSAGDHSPAKMIRMTLTVVLVYSLCWLPFNVLQVVREYWPEIHEWSYMHVFWFVCHWLAMSHSCYNPLILCWMNAKFRKCLLTFITRRLFCCCCSFKNVLRKRRSPSYPNSSLSLRRTANTSTTTTAGTPSGGTRLKKGGIKRVSTASSVSVTSQNDENELKKNNDKESVKSNLDSYEVSPSNEKLEMVVLDMNALQNFIVDNKLSTSFAKARFG